MALKQKLERIAHGLCGECGARPLDGRWVCAVCKKRKNDLRAAKHVEADNREQPRVDGNYIFAY